MTSPVGHARGRTRAVPSDAVRAACPQSVTLSGVSSVDIGFTVVVGQPLLNGFEILGEALPARQRAADSGRPSCSGVALVGTSHGLALLAHSSAHTRSGSRTMLSSHCSRNAEEESISILVVADPLARLSRQLRAVICPAATSRRSDGLRPTAPQPARTPRRAQSPGLHRAAQCVR